MTSILLVVGRDGRPVAPELPEGMAGGRRAWSRGRGWALSGPGVTAAALRRSPAGERGAEPVVAFDGRIDNREQLGAALGLDPAAAVALPDPELARLALGRWGGDAFRRLDGPFAAVAVDPSTGRVECGRDVLGRRPLFWATTRRRLLVASDATALLEHPEISDRLDDESVARFFALEPPAPGATYYADLRELGAGERLRYDGGTVRRQRFDELRPRPAREWRDRDEMGEALRGHLEAAVRRRLRGPGEPGVLMSGGLDSTSLAALAAEQVGPGLAAVSWVFDDLPACDERPAIAAMARRHRLRGVRIVADGLWPLRGACRERTASTAAPLANPYRELLDRCYEGAASAGVGVLLTGWFGDESLALAAPRRRAALAAWRGVRAGVVAARRNRAWLRRSTRALLGGSVAAGRAARQPRRWLVEGLAARAVAAELERARRHGVELRSPFCDRRLVEFLLSLPRARRDETGPPKDLLRRALSGALPGAVLRAPVSSLTPLFERALRRETDAVAALLDSAGADWHQRVRRTAVARWRRFGPRSGREAAQLWLCLSWELWRRRREAGAGLGRAA